MSPLPASLRGLCPHPPRCAEDGSRGQWHAPPCHTHLRVAHASASHALRSVCPTSGSSLGAGHRGLQPLPTGAPPAPPAPGLCSALPSPLCFLVTSFTPENVLFLRKCFCSSRKGGPTMRPFPAQGTLVHRPPTDLPALLERPARRGPAGHWALLSPQAPGSATHYQVGHKAWHASEGLSALSVIRPGRSSQARLSPCQLPPPRPRARPSPGLPTRASSQKGKF